MTETLWLAGMLFANLWAAGALDANNTEKDALQGAAAGSVPGSVLTRGDQDQQQKAIALANARAVLAASGSLNAQVDASRVLTLNPAFLNAEEQPAKSGDLRTTILPAIKHGEQAHCEQPPTQQEILSALPTLARGVPYVYEQYRDEVEFTVEKLVDRVDAPRWFPLIGPAQLHHCTWKCTVYYTDVIEIANPVPFTTRTKHTEVVFIDRDHLHLYGEQQNEGVSEQPQSCPGGHFRPTPKDIVKAEKPEPVQQVLLEITVASIDRAAVPDATYRWAMKQLGLTGDNVGFSVPKNRDAADDFVQALQNDGFVKPLEMRRVNTVSGRPARILSGYGGNTQTIASGAGSTYQLNLDLGTAVNLLPVAMANGKIHLEVAAEMNTVNTASLPILKRRANAASEMEDGQTIVIGGLTYTETTETDNSVPFLNELPYVGALFTSKEQQQTKRDLLILVTARLTPSVGSAEETSEPPLSSITPEATPFPTAAYKSEYAAAPADIVTIESRRFVPKAPYRLEPMDVLQIDAAEPIRGMYMITPEGNISLGESYRPIPVAGLTVAEAQRAIWDYLTQHPDLKDVSAFANVSLAQARGLQNISGEHLVRPDGTISLGMFGAVHVSGMTPGQIRCVVEHHLSQYLVDPQVAVQVAAYENPKIYVIVDGGADGRQVSAVRFEGQSLLDLIGELDEVRADNVKKIWVTRPATDGYGEGTDLPVDWKQLTQSGRSGVELQAGDRVNIELEADAEPAVQLYVIVDGGAEGRQVSVVPFAGQSVLDVIAGIDSVQADNVKNLWVTRPAASGNGHGTVLTIDWKQLTQTGRCGVELMPGDRVNVELEADAEPAVPLALQIVGGFGTIRIVNPNLYVIVDGGADGQRVSVVPFAGQSVLDVIAGIDEVQADNVKELWVTRRTADGSGAYRTIMSIDWKQLIQTGRCGVELQAGDRVNITLEPAAACDFLGRLLGGVFGGAIGCDEDRRDCRRVIAQAQESVSAVQVWDEGMPKVFTELDAPRRQAQALAAGNALRAAGKALPAAPSQAMSIDDVVRMSKAGVSQEIILRQIELTNAVFNLTVDDIISLTEHGVTERIISAMQERRTTDDSSARTFNVPPARSSGGAEQSEVENAIPGASEVVTFWYDQVQIVEDSVNGGKPLPGVVGRIYLSSGETKKTMVEANGCFHVEVYDAASGAKLSDHRFDTESLKQLKRSDFLGMGYTLFLPWENYRPEIKQIELRFLYMPEDGGQPLAAASQVIRLKTPETKPGVLQVEYQK